MRYNDARHLAKTAAATPINLDVVRGAYQQASAWGKKHPDPCSPFRRRTQTKKEKP